MFGDFARMKRETHIISYFSLPTDLAGEMRDWPEFVSGQEYSVDLKSSDSVETVVVGYVENGGEHYVSVSGEGSRRAEPNTSPNGGTATQLGNSEVSGAPPSVS